MPSSPTLLTPELSDRICRLIEEGNRNEVAAQAVGIDRSTLQYWLSKGNRGLAPYEAFKDAVYTARAVAEVEKLRISNRGDTKLGPDEAAGARFWMTRARSNHWAEEKRVTVEITAEITRFLEFLERKLPEKQYVQILSDWQGEQDNAGARGLPSREAQSGTERSLLGAPDVLDTEGEPPSRGA